ncbi:MAG TPA: PAS domain-containing protein, partial [Allocoleopsis sp.]
AYCRYFGVKPEDAIGKKYEPVVYEADREKVAELVASLSAENSVVTIENRVVVAGEVRWTQWRNRWLSDETGQFVEIQAVGRDITPLKQTEEQLRDLSDRLTLALEAGAIGTWDWDFIHPVSLDKGMYEIYGLQSLDQDMTYQDWLNLLHPDDRSDVDAALQQASKGEKEFDVEFRIIRPDGVLRFIKAFAIIQRNEQGKPQRMVGINYDITDRKQAEAALIKYAQEVEDLYNNAPCGYHSLDSQGCFTRLNETELRWLGYTREEMIGRPFTEFITQESCQTFWQNYPAFQQCGWVKDLEFEMICKDSSVLPVLINATAVIDEAGNYSYSRSTLLDIRKRKQAEQQLQQTNAELARATRLKDEFLANMSHELRTPLSSILGMSEMLQEKIYGELNQKQHQYIKAINQSGKHLLSLINDILDLAKIEAGKLELQITSISVKELCSYSLSFVKQIAHQKRIQLATQIPPDIGEINVDELRIRQALINLLSNAVKFTHEDGQVTLEVKRD